MYTYMAPYTIIGKPIGPVCNLECKYCYYIEKQQLLPKNYSPRMSYDILEAFVKQYIESQALSEVLFSWQGGEPTLLGIDFFRNVVELQNKYSGGKKVTNAFQTNGTLLDDTWCEFLSENHFLVGLSIDGHRVVHDEFRVDKNQRSTFNRVMKGIDYLKKHHTQFNTMTVVNDINSQHPLKVYRFLKEVGHGFMQFIPLVERKANKEAKELGLDLCTPPVHGDDDDKSYVTPWSVKPEQFGEFYVQIFDEWVREDVGKISVQFFDVALGNWMGLGSSLCQFAQTCGRAGALEHNGDLYACDHYVYPKYKIGNILEKPLYELMDSDFQRRFGQDKVDLLPQDCTNCDFRFACNGDCPKHRFKRTSTGEPGLSYLCAGYKHIFKYMAPYMQLIAKLVSSGGGTDKIAHQIMEYVSEEDRQKQIKRNGQVSHVARP